MVIVCMPCFPSWIVEWMAVMYIYVEDNDDDDMALN